MKEKFIHVCFVIDESGSMSGSENDVVGGFKKVIDEQKAVKEGTCAISLYKFSSEVSEVYCGKDINLVKPLKHVGYLSRGLNKENDDSTYSPSGCTAMFDGIGMAIDNVGKWLAGLDESERPEKNLIVIMTDGEENSSHKYSSNQIKEMIKHQEDKYNWSFVYMGTDITTTEYAESIGIKNRSYATKSDHLSNYSIVSDVTTVLRCSSVEKGISELSAKLSDANAVYNAKTGLNMN